MGRPHLRAIPKNPAWSAIRRGRLNWKASSHWNSCLNSTATASDKALTATGHHNCVAKVWRITSKSTGLCRLDVTCGFVELRLPARSFWWSKSRLCESSFSTLLSPSITTSGGWAAQSTNRHSLRIVVFVPMHSTTYVILLPSAPDGLHGISERHQPNDWCDGVLCPEDCGCVMAWWPGFIYVSIIEGGEAWVTFVDSCMVSKALRTFTEYGLVQSRFDLLIGEFKRTKVAGKMLFMILQKSFFRPSQPGSFAWMSLFLLCADHTCVLV